MIDGVDVVKEVGEPQLLINKSCLSYPIQRLWTAGFGHGLAAHWRARGELFAGALSLLRL